MQSWANNVSAFVSAVSAEMSNHKNPTTCTDAISDAGQVRDDKKPGGTQRLQRFVALNWNGLLLQMMQTALLPENLEDIGITESIDDLDDGCASEILRLHISYLFSFLKEMHEFGNLLQHYPWRCFLWLDHDKTVRANEILRAKREIEFLYKLEHGRALNGKAPSETCRHVVAFSTFLSFSRIHF